MPLDPSDLLPRTDISSQITGVILLLRMLFWCHSQPLRT